MFRQESMYYLSGYDSFGYVFFQCLYLSADGHLTLLTRAPDLRQARHTSIIEDIRIWTDSSDVDPAMQLKHILAEFGCKGRRLGVEYDSYGLTAKNGKLLEAALSVIIPQMNSLSARVKTRSCAATNPAAASLTPRISSPSSGRRHIDTTMPP